MDLLACEAPQQRQDRVACRQQNRNALELPTAACRARLDRSAPPLSLPAEAELAAA